MVRIELADVATHFDSATDLMRANWAETGFDFPFAPSREFYERMQASGAWFAFAAMRDQQMVGYVSAAVTPHPFNPAVVFCASEALFVDPPYRPASVGVRLIHAAEQEGKRRGAHWMAWHCRAGTTLAAVLEQRGYTPADEVVMRRL